MDLLARLRAATPPLLWDGGVGTGLLGRGLDLRVESPEAWLVRRPADVQAVHEEFVQAGSDVLQTDTFGLPRLLYGPGAALDLPAAALIRRAAELARAAAAPAGRTIYVIASLGPSGQDAPDPGRVTDLFAELATACSAAGLCAVHLETSCLPDELRAALRGVRAGAPGLPVLASLTLSLGDTGLQTPLGAPLAAMLRVLDREPPDAIGVNCSQNARRMRPQVEALYEFCRGALPILAQPQVDEAAVDCKRRTAPETGAGFHRGLRELLMAGATAVGGCCGCRGEHLHGFGSKKEGD